MVGEHGTRLADSASAAFTAWRAGETAELDHLVRLLTPTLWHLARAYRVDAATAEDAVQATWLALVRSADRIEDPQAVLRWLSVTVRREAARARRSGARVEATAPDLLVDSGPPTASAEDDVLIRNAASALWRHVHQLSERCQQLLRVIAFADRPGYDTLSRTLQMPVGSIGPTRGRCLDKLRAALASDPTWTVR